VLASLNHPNIAAIYGLAESEQVRGLVLELVDSVTSVPDALGSAALSPDSRPTNTAACR
jgi:hypothetical protein